MRFHELTELRKNPLINVKQSVNQAVLDHLNDAKQRKDYFLDRIPNSFVSFTKLDKLGINPKSDFDTPLGIYAYASYYVVDQIMDIDNEPTLAMDSLPFAGTSPYANLFSAAGNIVILDRSTKPDWSSLEQAAKRLGLSQESIDECIQGGIHGARVQTPIGQWFYASRLMAIQLTLDKKPLSTSVVWNKIFRLCGIDGLLDLGAGIIHPNEPHQAVFFHIGAVKDPIRISNKYSPNTMNLRQQIGDQAREIAGEIAAIVRKGNLSAKDFDTIAQLLIDVDNKTRDTSIANKILHQVLASPQMTATYAKQFFDALKRKHVLDMYNSKKIKNQIENSRKIKPEIKTAFEDWLLDYAEEVSKRY